MTVTPVSSLEDGFTIAAAKDGTIKLLDVDCRALWQCPGTWSSRAEDGSGAADIHNVYTQKGVIESYRKNGKFPDGTVIIKEILLTETKERSTGVLSHGTEIEGWFVMVKDTKGRFPSHPLWGKGWGVVLVQC